MLAKIAHVIEMAGLQIGIRRADIRHCGLAQDIGGDIFDRRIRDFMDKLTFLYSPDATREMTSRLVISGSTMASRPRRP